MHILADYYRSEFLATPVLFRIDHAKGADGFVPTLLLQANTLLLKYIVQGSALEMFVVRDAERLLYGVKVFDASTNPATIWSIAEHIAERDALMALINATECPIFLFNELSLNAAWTTVSVNFPSEVLHMIEGIALEPVDQCEMKNQRARLRESMADASCIRVLINPIHEWRETRNHYVTNQITVSPIHLFNTDEGEQQEQLAVWLTDSLQASGVIHSPKVPKGKGHRELTDLLLSYSLGTVLIESKTLTIFNRQIMPTRDTLATNMTKNINKAVKQLQGAVRNLQSGVPVFDKSGSKLNINRTQPVHAIVLIPDFDLIQNPTSYGKEFIADFMQTTNGYIHFLDIAELLRVVQAAELIARQSIRTTMIMAFDYILLKRAEQTYEADSLSIEVLHKVVN